MFHKWHPVGNVLNKQLQIMSNWKNAMSLQKYYDTDSHSDMALCKTLVEDK